MTFKIFKAHKNILYEVCPIRVLHCIYSGEPSQGGTWSLYTPLVDVWNEYRFFGTWIGSRVGLESSNFWIINHQVMGVNPKIWENPPNHPYFWGLPWNKPSILGFFPIFLETSIYFQRNTYHQVWPLYIIILFFIKMYDVIQKIQTMFLTQDPHFFWGENRRTMSTRFATGIISEASCDDDFTSDHFTTPPKFNIAPEKGPFEEECNLHHHIWEAMLIDELQPYKTILLYPPNKITPNCFQSCWLKIKSLLIANGQKIFKKK